MVSYSDVFSELEIPGLTKRFCFRADSTVAARSEALAEAERAKQLDPLNLMGNVLLGVFLYESRQYNYNLLAIP